MRRILKDTPPSQAVTRPVSPSQPDSPAKRIKTSLTTYSTPAASPAQLSYEPIEPGPSNIVPATPEILSHDMHYMPIRRSTSLPLTTIVPPEPPFDIDVPPEPEGETHSVNSTDFICSMYTWDDPTIVQPEDAALFLYLAGTLPY